MPIRVQSTVAAFRAVAAKSKNVGWAYVLQSANLLSSLIIVPFLARALGTEGYGAYASAFNILTYLTVITAYGFQLWGAREIGSLAEPADRGRLFYAVFFARVLLLIPAVLVWALIGFGFLGGTAAGESLIWLGLALLGLTFNSSWLFIGLGALRAPAVAAVATKLAVMFATVLLVDSPGDAKLYCALFGLGSLAEAGIHIWQLRNLVSVSPILARWGDITAVLTKSFSLFLSNALGVLLAGAPLFVLTVMSTPDEVGGFAGLLRLPQLLVALFVPLSNALYPSSCRVARMHGGKTLRRSLRLLALVMPVVGLGALILVCLRVPVVNWFLGAEFVPFASLMLPLSLWIVAAIAANLLGIHGLVAANRQKAYFWAMSVALVATYGSSFLVVDRYGVSGVAFSMLLGEALGVIVMGAAVAAKSWSLRR